LTWSRSTRQSGTNTRRTLTFAYTPGWAGNITGNTGLGDGSAVSHRSLLRPAVVNGGVTDRGYNNVGIDLRLLERTHTLIVACLRAILY